MTDYDGAIGVQVVLDNLDKLDRYIDEYLRNYCEEYRQKINKQKLINLDSQKCRLMKNKEIELTRIKIRKENKKHDEFRRKS